MKNVNSTILAGDDSASINGSAVDASQLITASFQAVFSDTDAVGTIKIQASNDLCPQGAPYNANFVPTNWSDIPSASASITAGGLALIPIPQISYRWIRAVWTRSSGGSSVVRVNMNAMGV